MNLVLIHVAISLVGILSGLVVLFGMFTSKRMNGMTALFLLTTVLTSATGYLLPAKHIMPSHIVGAISLVLLTFAIVARYSLHMAGPWRWIYVVTAVFALYLNFFVLVVQSFLKVPSLHALAPSGSEPPFVIAQVVLLILFIAFTIRAAAKFHPQ